MVQSHVTDIYTSCCCTYLFYPCYLLLLFHMYTDLTLFFSFQWTGTRVFPTPVSQMLISSRPYFDLLHRFHFLTLLCMHIIIYQDVYHAPRIGFRNMTSPELVRSVRLVSPKISFRDFRNENPRTTFNSKPQYIRNMSSQSLSSSEIYL